MRGADCGTRRPVSRDACADGAAQTGRQCGAKAECARRTRGNGLCLHGADDERERGARPFGGFQFDRLGVRRDCVRLPLAFVRPIGVGALGFSADGLLVGVDTRHDASARSSFQLGECDLGHVYLRAGRRLFDLCDRRVALRIHLSPTDVGFLPPRNRDFGCDHVCGHGHAAHCSPPGAALAGRNHGAGHGLRGTGRCAIAAVGVRSIGARRQRPMGDARDAGRPVAQRIGGAVRNDARGGAVCVRMVVPGGAARHAETPSAFPKGSAPGGTLGGVSALWCGGCATRRGR